MKTSLSMHEKFSSVVPIRPYGSAPPLFFIHGVGGVVPEFEKLLEKLDPRHPVYGIQSQAFDPHSAALLTLEEMAAYYLAEVRQVVSSGPYHLIGFSFGGMVAFEMAQQIRTQGEERPIIFMIDSAEMSYLKRQAKSAPTEQRASEFYHRLRRRFGEAFRRSNPWSFIQERVNSRFHRALYSLASKFGISISSSVHEPYHVNWFAAVNYSPRPYDESFFLFKAKDHFWEPGTPPDLGWGTLAQAGLQIFEIPGDHESMFVEPNVSVLGGYLAQCVEKTSLAAQND